MSSQFRGALLAVSGGSAIQNLAIRHAPLDRFAVDGLDYAVLLQHVRPGCNPKMRRDIFGSRDDADAFGGTTDRQAVRRPSSMMSGMSEPFGDKRGKRSRGRMTSSSAMCDLQRCTDARHSQHARLGAFRSTFPHSLYGRDTYALRSQSSERHGSRSQLAPTKNA